MISLSIREWNAEKLTSHLTVAIVFETRHNSDKWIKLNWLTMKWALTYELLSSLHTYVHMYVAIFSVPTTGWSGIYFLRQRCRYIFKSGGASSNVVDMICPLWTSKSRDAKVPPAPPLTTALPKVITLIYLLELLSIYYVRKI